MPSAPAMKKKKFRSIQTTIAVVFSSFFIVVILITGIAFYVFSEKLIQDISLRYTVKLVDQVYNNINSYIQYMKHISNIINNNKDIQEYLFNDTQFDNTKRLSYEDKISNLMKSIQQTRNDINLIMIFGFNGEIISNRPEIRIKAFLDYKNQDWYTSALHSGGDSIISSSHIQNFFIREYRWVVSLSRKIYSIKDDSPLGILLIDLNFNVIKDLCSSVFNEKQGYFFIVDDVGKLIYHPYQELIYSGIRTELLEKVNSMSEGSFISQENELKKLYIVKSSPDSNWKIVGVTFLNEFIVRNEIMQPYYVILGISSILVIVIISLLLSKRISRPIKNLRYSMREVENGNFDISVVEKTPNEIGELERDFNIMICKIKELMHEIVVEHEHKRKSDIESLQAQINPHFLYNTLDSIIWLAANKKSREILKMTSALSSLLRIGISKGESFIFIKEEIEHIRSYLTIQKMRYNEKLDFTIEVDKSVLELKTLKLILQPLVENSIYHGIKNKEGTGLIEVKCLAAQDHVVFIVKDNGVGMDEDRIQEVFYSSNQAGIGISNVKNRIRLHYGEAYGLTCHSVINEGTTIELRIPRTVDGKSI